MSRRPTRKQLAMPKSMQIARLHRLIPSGPNAADLDWRPEDFEAPQAIAPAPPDPWSA